MKAKHRFILAVVVLGLLMTGPFVVTSLLVWIDMKEAERDMLFGLLVSRLPIGTMMTLFGFAIGVLVLHKLFKQYVEGLLRMAETLRLMLGANRNFRVTPEGPPEVQQLARATNDLAQQRDALMDDVEAQIATAKASVEEEKNRLAALMSELAQAVVVCNLDGRILLYNNRARLQFKALAQGPTSVSGGALIGLGRSIFSILEKNQVQHAQDVIRQRLASGKTAMANFITTLRSGQLLRVQMVPVLAGAGEEGEATMSGYVLTVENITRSIEQEARRDQALHSLTEGSRAAIANIRAAVTNLIDYPDMETELRERFLKVIDDEVAKRGHSIDQTMSEFSDSLKTRWPLEDILGIDVIAAAQRRIEDKLKLPTKTEDLDDALWVKADSFSLVFALLFLASRLQDHYEPRELRFRLTSAGKLAYLDLIWAGPAMSSETFYTWEMESMQAAGETTPLSLREVIDRHGGEIWYQREKAAHRAFFRFVLPVATPEIGHDEEGARGSNRPEYYDFDLFKFEDKSIDLDRKLSDLTYTVFDTETTGLEPSKGDEIIQVGAARIVNNRLLRQEIFNQLVDPECPLKPESIPIHGISEDMVRGQPNIDVVLPAFHEFCEDTVLIAHNAAFDMRFLQLKEERTGIRFTQPVLDTLLLSAVIHPNQESHKLDVILERLGIQIGQRHNALEDALATAEVFLKMIPLLEEKGIVTVRQALEASEKTYFARVKYLVALVFAEILPGARQLALENELETLASLGDAPALAGRIASFLRDLAARDMNGQWLTRLISAFNDRLAVRIIELTARRHRLPMVSWCWLALGSEGRHEQTFVSDQDNGLVFSAADDKEADALRELFLPFAREVNQRLADCGFALCSGGIMAGNPAWCLSLDEWREQFIEWVRRPQPQALLNASIFFDLRPLYGATELGEALRGLLLALTVETPAFLQLMAANALQADVPLNFRGEVVAEGTRSAREIDLKKFGSRIFVDAARIFALAHGSCSVNTSQRLHDAGLAAGLQAMEIAAVDAAFSHILRLRLNHQAAKGRDMPAAGHGVALESLHEVDRAILKESLKHARRLQQRLKLNYGL